MSNFEILSICKLSKNRQLVVSKSNVTNDIVIATRIEVEDEGTKRYYYDKGSIIVEPTEFKKLIIGEELINFLENVE